MQTLRQLSSGVYKLFPRGGGLDRGQVAPMRQRVVRLSVVVDVT